MGGRLWRFAGELGSVRLDSALVAGSGALCSDDPDYQVTCFQCLELCKLDPILMAHDGL